MVVNFRIREISRDTYKLIRTPILIKKIKKTYEEIQRTCLKSRSQATGKSYFKAKSSRKKLEP